MPPFADANRVSLRYIQENTLTWGTTPAGGSVRELRVRSSSLAATKETVVSDELRADRMVGSVVEVAAMSGGDIEFEYSAGSHDDFLEAVLAGTWTRPMTFDDFTGTILAWTANNTITVTGVDASLYLQALRRIKTEGFLNPANNNYWDISTISFTGGVTTITTTQTTAVVEPGNAFSKLMDANDAIVIRATNVSLSGNTITAGSAIFSSAISASQLNVGQKISLEGLGFQEAATNTPTGATVTFTAVAVSANNITLNDGVNSLAFSFDPAAVQISGVPAVVVAPGAALANSAANLAAAINRARVFGVNGVRINVTASSSAGVVSLRNIGNTSVTLTGNLGAQGSSTNFSGTAVPSARGIFTITALTGTTITVAESLPTFAAGPPVTIKGSMLRNPGTVAAIQPKSFSIETGFNDVSRFMTQNGMRPGTFSINVQAGQLVTGTISFMGRQTIPRSGTPLLGAAPYLQQVATSTEVLNATSNVGTLVKNGTALATALQSIEIQIEGGLRNQNSVGSKFPRGVGLGRLNVTGTIQAYFETLEMYNHFINHETISLSFSFTDVESNVIFWTIPALKINSDPVAPGGIDQDVMEQLEFVAFRDPTTACMVQVDRFSSTLPV